MWLSAILFGLGTLSGAASDIPVIREPGVVSAADHRGGVVSPGEIVVIYVDNAGPEVLVGQPLDERGRLLTSLGEARVLFDGIPAPMAYAVRGEMGAVVPYEVAGRRSTEVVVEYKGQGSEP